jgi:hypothetical protein
MINFPKYLGAVALAALCTVGHAGPASADTKFICDMKGTWLEAAEDWLFSADYISHPAGADSFNGVFANPKAGATANVIGNALQGTWTIIMNYTDAGHPGWVKRLIGTGKKDPVTHELVVTGNFTLSKSGTQTGNGTFRLHGKCKAR